MSWGNGNRFSVVTIGARVSVIPGVGTGARSIRTRVRTVTGSRDSTSPAAAGIVRDIGAAAVDRVDRNIGSNWDRGFVWNRVGNV